MRERCPACWRITPPDHPKDPRCTCTTRQKRVARLVETRDDWIPIPSQRLPQEPSAGEESTTESEGSRRSRLTRHNLAEIHRLEAEADHREGRQESRDDPLFGRGGSAERHRGAGSYRELGAALEVMERDGGLAAWAAWVCERVYARRVPTAASLPERLVALDTLSGYLPERIRIPNNPLTTTEQREQLEADILRYHAEARSSRWIGDKVGKSHTYVQSVIRRSGA